MLRKSRIMYMLIYIFLPLLLGVLIYILFRKPIPIFKSILFWNRALIRINFLPIALSDFIQYYLSDMFWTFSFSSMLYLLFPRLKVVSIFVIAYVAVFEFLQGIHVITGTGDIFDLIFSACSVLILNIILRRRGKNEQKT